jgi:hypothetical protein
MDKPKKSKRLIIWNGGSSLQQGTLHEIGVDIHTLVGKRK